MFNVQTGLPWFIAVHLQKIGHQKIFVQTGGGEGGRLLQLSLKPTVDSSTTWSTCQPWTILLAFDLNKDGVIGLEEAMMTTDNFTTVEDFKEVDVDNDGFVHPKEFDSSLNI